VAWVSVQNLMLQSIGANERIIAAVVGIGGRGSAHVGA